MLELTIKTRNCTHCGTSFDITDIDRDFLSRLAPTIAGKVYPLPFPKECPTCRKSRRYAWRNEHKIFKRKCDATGKEIISLFAPDAPCPVYASEYWYSDAWSAHEYGRDFDFSRSFFTQWAELKRVVPMPGKNISRTMENSDYSDNCGNLKNCYLCFNAGDSENCYYSTDMGESTYCVDSIGLLRCQECYEIANAYQCYGVHFSYDVKNCRFSKFLYSCEDCEYCYGCTHLKNQKYHIFNQPYEKDTYLQMLEKIEAASQEKQKEDMRNFLIAVGYSIKPPADVLTENIIDSEEVHSSKNIWHSTTIRNSKDIRYCRGLADTELAMDVTIWGGNLSRAYECYSIGDSASDIYFCPDVWNNVSYIYYSLFCVNNVHHCFGCIGLRNSEYCILNKQYTKEEYESLVPKIIEKMMADGEWGEFFPRGYSHFGYNHTMNMDKYPLSREEALSQGFYWSDYVAPPPVAEKVIPGSRLPRDIEKIPDDILNWVIECEVSAKLFRIVPAELEFYRKHSLPVPTKHPDERYKERSKIYINY